MEFCHPKFALLISQIEILISRICPLDLFSLDFSSVFVISKICPFDFSHEIWISRIRAFDISNEMLIPKNFCSIYFVRFLIAQVRF